MTKPKIAFVYNLEDERYWRDGLWRALKELDESGRCEIPIRANNRPLSDYADLSSIDFRLVWGALGSEQVSRVAQLAEHGHKKGICVAGGPLDHPDIHKFDVAFVETQWHVDEFRKRGINAKLAFGTNTDLFMPIPAQKKTWRAIYPAAFAKWKRHEIFTKKYGRQGLVVGYMQPSNPAEVAEVVLACEENGCTILPQVTPEVLVWLYNASKRVHITSDLHGGGERAVLEGLACGLPVRVEKDNPKLTRLLEANKERLQTHDDYADALIGGIEQCLAVS